MPPTAEPRQHPASAATDMGSRPHADSGVIELDHAATMTVAVGGFQDHLADVDREDRRPEPVDPVFLPAPAGEEDQQAEIDRAQTAVLDHYGVKPCKGDDNDDGHRHQRRAADHRMVALKQASENQEKSRVRHKMGPAEVHEMSGPDTPPFAPDHRVTVVDQHRPPSAVALDDDGRNSHDEKHPRDLVERENLSEERAHAVGQEKRRLR